MASHSARPLYIQQEANPTSWYKKNKKHVSAFAEQQPPIAEIVTSRPSRIRSLEVQQSRASPKDTLAKATEARPSQRSPHLTQDLLKALEREKSLQEIGIVFDSESDSSDSSEDYAGLELHIPRAKYSDKEPQKPLPGESLL